VSTYDRLLLEQKASEITNQIMVEKTGIKDKKKQEVYLKSHHTMRKAKAATF